MYSPFIFKLCAFLGLPNPQRTVAAFNDMLEKVIAENEDVDVVGNYIERYRAEMTKHADDQGSSFFGQDGALHLLGHLQDIFVAGKYDLTV